MSTDLRPTRLVRAPLADLERALIDTFLVARGFDGAALAALPPAARDALLKEASVHASAKLAEIEARSHYLHELHE
jgi:hypothetical protein